MMMTLALAAFFPSAGHAAAWGVLISGVLQFALLAGDLARHGGLPRFAPLRLDEDVRAFFRALGPATLGSMGTQVALFADTIIATFLPAGALSALYYADRLDVQAKFSARRGEYDRRETDIVSSNTASVNMAAPDLAAFPKLADALKAVRAVTVAAGDCLYLPRRWHHHVFTEADPDEGFNAAVNIWIDREKTLQEHHEVTAGLHHAYHGGRPTFADVLAAIGGGTKAKVKLVPHPEHGLAHDEL